MKAIVIREPGGPEALELRDVPEPEPSGEEVRVKVHATALNRADLLQRRGLYPAPPGSPQDIPGLEFAGTVEKAGSAVQSLKAGDRVFGLLGGGGYSEKIVTHERMAVKVPENLSWEEAAAVPEVFITAHDALVTQCGLTMGERVLIHAVGGGVGTAAVQIAKAIGAGTIGTAGSKEKLSRAEELGLDVGVNYREEDFAEVIKKRYGRAGVHVILDVIGPGYWEQNLRSLGLCGRMVIVGMMGMGKADLQIPLIMTKRLRIFGTVLRSRPLEEKIAATQAFATSIVPLIASGRMRPVIDCTYPLDRAREAQEYMEANKNFGKIILTM